MRKKQLKQKWANIKESGRFISNLKNTGDTALLAECLEDLQRLDSIIEVSELNVSTFDIKKTKFMIIVKFRNRHGKFLIH